MEKADKKVLFSGLTPGSAILLQRSGNYQEEAKTIMTVQRLKMGFGHRIDHINENNDRQQSDSDYCVFQQVTVKRPV